MVLRFVTKAKYLRTRVRFAVPTLIEPEGAVVISSVHSLNRIFCECFMRAADLSWMYICMSVEVGLGLVCAREVDGDAILVAAIERHAPRGARGEEADGTGRTTRGLPRQLNGLAGGRRRRPCAAEGLGRYAGWRGR